MGNILDIVTAGLTHLTDYSRKRSRESDDDTDETDDAAQYYDDGGDLKTQQQYKRQKLDQFSERLEPTAPPMEVNECFICSQPFISFLEKSFLPCAHCYHKQCYENWLKIEESCPLCKGAVIEY